MTRPIKHDILLAAGGPAASLIFALALGASFLLFDGNVTIQLWLIATAILSVLLAILNLIPVPGLDGGHLLLLIAARFGRELTPHQEITAHRLGTRLIVLLCLVVMVMGVGRSF
jgi:regulator of sigma E protease